MDRFKYVDPPEPKIIGLCPECRDYIIEGDEVVHIGVEGVDVHEEDCYLSYASYLLESESKIAGEE